MQACMFEVQMKLEPGSADATIVRSRHRLDRPLVTSAAQACASRPCVYSSDYLFLSPLLQPRGVNHT